MRYQNFCLGNKIINRAIIAIITLWLYNNLDIALYQAPKFI